jgi:hypothetical protein
MHSSRELRRSSFEITVGDREVPNYQALRLLAPKPAQSTHPAEAAVMKTAQ